MHAHKTSRVRQKVFPIHMHVNKTSSELGQGKNIFHADACEKYET